MIDTRNVKALLRALNAAASSDMGLTDEVLAIEIETINRRPLTTVGFDDACTLARDKGWAASTTDDFGRRCWTITDAGKHKIKEVF